MGQDETVMFTVQLTANRSLLIWPDLIPFFLKDGFPGAVWLNKSNLWFITLTWECGAQIISDFNILLGSARQFHSSWWSSIWQKNWIIMFVKPDSPLSFPSWVITTHTDDDRTITGEQKSYRDKETASQRANKQLARRAGKSVDVSREILPTDAC